MADLKAIIKKHFEPIFKAYDKDHSSTLEKDELRALLADNLGVNENAITQEQLDWHFGKIDADGDGKITFNEYVIFVFRISSLTSSDKELKTQWKTKINKAMKETWSTRQNSKDLWKTPSDLWKSKLLKRWSTGTSPKSIRTTAEESLSTSTWSSLKNTTEVDWFVV